jgi:hypothetical protein
MSLPIRTGRLVAGRNGLMKYGDPRPSATWPGRLRLDPETADLLLIAAADFAECSEEAGEYQSAVGFVDWVVGVLRQTHFPGPEADGAPARSESGGFKGHKDYQHRHPFVLPQAELSRKLRVG